GEDLFHVKQVVFSPGAGFDSAQPAGSTERWPSDWSLAERSRSQPPSRTNQAARPRAGSRGSATPPPMFHVKPICFSWMLASATLSQQGLRNAGRGLVAG